MAGPNLGLRRVRLRSRIVKRETRHEKKREKTRREGDKREAMRILGHGDRRCVPWRYRVWLVELSPGPRDKRRQIPRLSDQLCILETFPFQKPTFLSFNRQSSNTHITLYIFLSFHTTYYILPPTTNQIHISRCSSQLKSLSPLLSLLLPMPL